MGEPPMGLNLSKRLEMKLISRDHRYWRQKKMGKAINHDDLSIKKMWFNHLINKSGDLTNLTMKQWDLQPTFSWWNNGYMDLSMIYPDHCFVCGRKTPCCETKCDCRLTTMHIMHVQIKLDMFTLNHAYIYWLVVWNIFYFSIYWE